MNFEREIKIVKTITNYQQTQRDRWHKLGKLAANSEEESLDPLDKQVIKTIHKQEFGILVMGILASAGVTYFTYTRFSALGPQVQGILAGCVGWVPLVVANKYSHSKFQGLKQVLLNKYTSLKSD